MLIEECMIMANVAAAQFVEKNHGSGSVSYFMICQDEERG